MPEGPYPLQFSRGWPSSLRVLGVCVGPPRPPSTFALDLMDVVMSSGWVF